MFTDQNVQIEEVLYSEDGKINPGDRIGLRQIGGIVWVGSARVEEVNEELPNSLGAHLHLFLAKEHGNTYWLLPAEHSRF